MGVSIFPFLQKLESQPGSGTSQQNRLVKCILVDPTDSMRLFVGTYWDGLWYSGDQGNSWSQATSTLSDITYKSIQRITSSPDGIIWAAFDDGVYTSTDHGRTFEKSFPDIPNLGEHEFEYIEDVIINSSNPNEMYACSAKRFPVYYNRGSVWKSMDSGQNWQEITGDLSMKRVTRLALFNGYLYASTDGANVFRIQLPEFYLSYLQNWHQTTICSSQIASVLDFIHIMERTCFVPAMVPPIR